ncbi:MAG: TldD/PmbA family protein [Nocardioidaceae bacterium]
MADLLDVAHRVLRHAEPGEEVEAYAAHRLITSVEVGEGAVVRQVGRAETRGVGVLVLARSCAGYASTADLSDAGLRRVVEQARDNGAIADPDEAVTIAGRRGGPGDDLVPFVDPALEAMTLESKIAMVTDLARQVPGVDPRIPSVDSVDYRDELITAAIASTRGTRVEHRRGFAEMYVDVTGQSEGADAGEYSAWCGRNPLTCDLPSLAIEAVDRATRLLTREVALPAVAVPIVLDPTVVADLLAAVGRACSGGPVSSGRTPFAGRFDDVVASGAVTLVDDGLLATAPGAGGYDDEGVPRQRTELIRGGVLVGTLHNSTTAAAVGSGATSTGSARRTTHKAVSRAAATALRLQENCSLPDLLERAGEAVYIQSLTGAGSGINALTGRVNVGGIGWLMRDGQPMGRLPTVPVSTSLEAILRAVELVADDARPRASQPVVTQTLLCAPGWLSW